MAVALSPVGECQLRTLAFWKASQKASLRLNVWLSSRVSFDEGQAPPDPTFAVQQGGGVFVGLVCIRTLDSNGFGVDVGYVP